MENNNKIMNKTIRLALLSLSFLVLFCGKDDGAGPTAAEYNVTYDGNGSTGGSVPVDNGGYVLAGFRGPVSLFTPVHGGYLFHKQVGFCYCQYPSRDHRYR